MHIRRDPKRLRDGRLRTYLSLAHNVWESGPLGKKRARPVIFARLGALEDLELDTVRSMREAFDRFLQRQLAEEGLPPEPAPEQGARVEAVERAADTVASAAPALRILASRAYGMRALVEPVWERLGLAAVMESIAGQHRHQFSFERVLFGMVLNRLVDPKSKRACNEWLAEDAYFPEAEGWQVQHFYRALDMLEAHANEVSAAISKAVRDRLDPEALRLVLMDTTSTYFESDYDDEERAAIAEEWLAHYRGEREAPSAPEPQVVNEPPVRLRGKSKDHRPDKPQVVLGLLCAGGGQLLETRMYPGNTNDQKITMGLLELAALSTPDATPVVVIDSGMGGGPNLAAIDGMDEPPHRISAVPLRSSKVAEAMLRKPGRWRQHPDKEHFKVRVEHFTDEESPSGRAELWIATRNQRAADRQRRQVEKHVARVRAVLDKDDSLDDHNVEVCKLQSHRTLKRYVRPSKNGRRLLLNRERVRTELRRAGVKVLRSTLVEHDPIEVLRSYEELLHVEDDIRTYKGPLKLRPMYHRSAHRIRAHVLICTLAMVCLQELEHRTGLRFGHIKKLVGRVTAAQMEQGNTRFWQRSEWPEAAEEVLAKLDVRPGPRTWGAERLEEVTEA
jgi:hypothetical protein